MSDQQNLLDNLLTLRSKMEQLIVLRQTPDNSEQIMTLYKSDIVPHLLKLRKINRSDWDEIELRSKKLKEHHSKLSDLYDQCDCLVYKVSCLDSEVEAVKQRVSESLKVGSPIKNAHDSFNPSNIELLEHNERMRILEEEETKRKCLVNKLKESEDETKKVADLCTSGADYMDKMKPYIKQLLNEVGPTLSPDQ